MGYMSTDPYGNPVWVDDYGQSQPLIGQSDYTGQTFYGPATQSDYTGQTWNLGGNGQPTPPPPTQTTKTEIKPADAPLGTYTDKNGVQRPKVPTAPPAYDPLPDFTANANDWERKQTNWDIYTTEALRGAQLERQGALQDWQNNTQPLINQIPGFYQQADADRRANTSQLAGTYRGLNAADQAGLDQFNGRMNDLYNTQVPNIQAAQWQSLQSDLNNQNQALGNFNDIYGGSLDYQAAQAQASLVTQVAQAEAKLAKLKQYSSNPNDIARQEQALQDLYGMIDGGEWANNMREVRDKYKGLSDPEITAQERFMMEQFRQQREDAERSRRDAVMTDLGGRGLRSGAAEQAGMLTAQQELGRQNVLAQLGAEANAIDRSNNALAGWANTSAQGRNAQLAAEGMYIDAAGQLRDMNDRVGMFNTGEANATERYNAGLQTQTNQFNAGQRNQVAMHNSAMQTNTNQFNAAQQNQASANNQQTRLSGAYGYANQANQIRSDNDAVGTFNTGQTNLINMQNQQKDIQMIGTRAGIAGQQQAIGTGTRAGIAGREGEIADRQQGDIDARLGGQLAGTGALIGWQGENLDRRGGMINAGADTAITTHGVFAPTATTAATNRNALIGAKFAQDTNKRLG